MEPKGDPSTKGQYLINVKDWLRKQPHLPDGLEDSHLLSFLRGCKFSLEKTKRKLDMYFTMRAACPEFFTDRDITRPELMDLMTRAQNPTLPGLTPDGRTVTICRGLDKKLKTEQLKDAMKIMSMVCDLRLREQTEEITGDVYIIDVSIVQPSHLRNLSLTIFKKFFICVQEAYPLRLKEIHVVNAGTMVDTLFNIAKLFLNEKMKKRVHFHQNYGTLQDFIPKNMLPPEYGGTNCTIAEATKIWVEKLKKSRDWFEEQESIKVNEALRPGKPRNYDEMFGIDGSFRQLVID